MRYWREALWKQIQDLGQKQVECELTVCLGSQVGQLYPGVHQAQRSHRMRGGAALLCSVLCGFTLSTVCGLGYLSTKRAFSYWSVQRRAAKISNSRYSVILQLAVFHSKFIRTSSLNVHKAISICTTCTTLYNTVQLILVQLCTTLRSVDWCQEIKPFVVKCISL